MDTEQQDQEMPESKSIIMGEIQNIVEQPQQQVQTICSGQTKFMDKNIEQTFLETTQQEEVVYQIGNHVKWQWNIIMVIFIPFSETS